MDNSYPFANIPQSTAKYFKKQKTTLFFIFCRTNNYCNLLYNRGTLCVLCLMFL